MVMSEAKQEETGVIAEAPAHVSEVILTVINMIKKTGARGRPVTLMSACRKTDVTIEYVNECVRRYADLNAAARKAGIKIGGKRIPVITRKPSQVGETTIPVIDTSKALVPYTLDRDASILDIIECLEKGMPFPAALRHAGVTKHQLAYWVKEEPDLPKVMQKAEAKWAKGFFELFNKALKVAAEKGNVDAFIDIAEKRFFNSWGTIADIDTHEAVRAKDAIDGDHDTDTKKKNGIQIIIDTEEVTCHGNEVQPQ
jgi:hypothetical protein